MGGVPLIHLFSWFSCILSFSFIDTYAHTQEPHECVFMDLKVPRTIHPQAKGNSPRSQMKLLWLGVYN